MKEYILAISAEIIMTEIILMLMPDGGMKKFARIALGILLMLMIITPVKSCEIDVPETDADNNNTGLTYSKIIMDVYNEAMSNNN